MSDDGRFALQRAAGIARELGAEWGIGGSRQPTNEIDRVWMAGYAAAASQIAVAIEREAIDE